MNIFSLYVPPNNHIPALLIKDLEKNYENFILMGDLNAKIVDFGSTKTNHNGEILNELFETTSLMTINNRVHTHVNFVNDESNILDWIILNSKLIDYFKSFEVLSEEDMGSDHLPIIANFHTIGKSKRDNNIQEENYI
jgi:endonuclease/exonuclease/phosphatase family metal-dependent hydrolase